MSKDQIQRELLFQIYCAIRESQSSILDPIEQELGGEKNWIFIRNRLLNALGERGLSGKISKIVELNFANFESK